MKPHKMLIDKLLTLSRQAHLPVELDKELATISDSSNDPQSSPSIASLLGFLNTVLLVLLSALKSHSIRLNTCITAE